MTLSPSSLNFGKQQVGTTSQPQTVTLTNYAPMAVTIFGVDITGRNPGSYRMQSTTCKNTLPARGSCTINIVFAPKGLDGKIADLEVNDNGGLSPQIVSLMGKGTN
jgi:Cep192 domain 4